jgi:peptide/nickel transport system permease protein
MQRFLIRRFVIVIITLFAVSIIIFIMARAGGDPRSMLLDDYATEEQWDDLGRALGIDRPYYQQYGIFIADVFRGNFGQSIKERRPVIDIISQRVWPTFQLAIAAFIFSLAIGIPLGVLSSIQRGSVLDVLGKMVALIGQSAPSFWLGIMFMFWFAVKLGWVPPSGRGEWKAIILPTVTLGWVFIAANLRLMRSAMLDVLDSEYVKLARAKGVSGTAVVWKHAFRNAMIPPLTFAGVNLGSLITGSLTTELVFAWPGLGQLAVQALWAFDYPLLQGIVIVYTLMYVAAAFFVDVLYAYIDPRIRYA